MALSDNWSTITLCHSPRCHRSLQKKKDVPCAKTIKYGFFLEVGVNIEREIIILKAYVLYMFGIRPGLGYVS